MKIDINLLRKRLETFLQDDSNQPCLPDKVLKSNPLLKDLELEFFASESWRCGGLTGGNCWGDQADHPVESDPENQITSLDKFLEEFYPETSFLVYRKLLDKISYTEYSNYEYYGNYNIYRFKYITLEEIISVFENECDTDFDEDNQSHYSYR